MVLLVEERCFRLAGDPVFLHQQIVLIVHYLYPFAQELWQVSLLKCLYSDVRCAKPLGASRKCFFPCLNGLFLPISFSTV